MIAVNVLEFLVPFRKKIASKLKLSSPTLPHATKVTVRRQSTLAMKKKNDRTLRLSHAQNFASSRLRFRRSRQRTLTRQLDRVLNYRCIGHAQTKHLGPCFWQWNAHRTNSTPVSYMTLNCTEAKVLHRAFIMKCVHFSFRLKHYANIAGFCHVTP